MRTPRRLAPRLAALWLWVAACGDDAPGRGAAVWRTDCPPVDRSAALDLEAARQAHRLAARRHELRLREAAAPGFFLRELTDALDAERVANGDVCLEELADLGQLLFEHEYAPADGLGGGALAKAPQGPFRRVHDGLFGGPETISCPSCHWIGGPNGAGAETDNAFLQGDGWHTASGDERNAPALLGVGVVQALAQEMTAELQRQRAGVLRDAARSGAGRAVRLRAKGIEFGVLRASPDGTVDTSGVRGVDPDLVVKPFGWKGTHATLAEFASEALQVHMGIQSDALLASAPEEVVGAGDDPMDRDDDGVRHELGRGPFAALTAHLALLEMPIVEPLVQDRELAPAATARRPPTRTSFVADFQRGRRQFHALGCAGCHTPKLVLENPVLVVNGLPPIDLARSMRQPGLRYDPAVGGYPVWLFSDLKRHDMGRANAARHVQRGVPVREYLTPRLWGIADSGPYLHDGRAPSFDYAIAGHDGEGEAARAAFERLSMEDKGALRVYLMSLRRAPRLVVP
ncbi:MAG TPA: di-heme oxidoredictase family protein [Candidatus Limnocylindria bacterium]|nr:di-heme oxidoredictase family protein [Candidatus Limnocylindria bacterium]